MSFSFPIFWHLAAMFMISDSKLNVWSSWSWRIYFALEYIVCGMSSFLGLPFYAHNAWTIIAHFIAPQRWSLKPKFKKQKLLAIVSTLSSHHLVIYVPSEEQTSMTTNRYGSLWNHKLDTKSCVICKGKLFIIAFVTKHTWLNDSNLWNLLGCINGCHHW